MSVKMTDVPREDNGRNVHVHGGDIYSAESELGVDRTELLDFSANIMPAKIDDQVRTSICSAIDDCRYYPDPQQRRLRQALAKHHKLDPQQIVCGNGAADLIYRAAYALKPDRAYLPVPSFAEYEQALTESECEIHYWQLKQKNDFRIDQNMLDWLQRSYVDNQSEKRTGNSTKTDLLILCQPNNPTGLLIAPAILQKLLKFCSESGIYILIDECFLDFLSREKADIYSSLDCLSDNRHTKLMILRSMTKYYSMPGLRAGYLCTSPELAAKLMATGQPWPVSTLTEAAVLTILDRDRSHHDEVSSQVNRWLAVERPFLESALVKKGFTVWQGSANFIFFRAKNCPDLKEQLLKQKILIRSCEDYIGLDDTYYRIAILSHTANQQLIDALEYVCVWCY